MLVSIVTPNLNRGDYLAFTMDSVLASRGGSVDYIVVDGGSTDNSLHVIEQHLKRISAVICEPDDGVYDAINKGFAKSTGQIMGWLNSGDYLFPDSVSILCEVFERFPEIQWVTSRILSFLDAQGRLVEQSVHQGVARESFLSGEHLIGYSRGPALSFIQQESTFWRRSLWERAGARLNTQFKLAADFELWTRFFDYADLWTVSSPLGAFRRHSDQLSRAGRNDYISEAREALAARGGRPRNRVGQSVSVGLRLKLPRQLRRMAHRARLFAPAPFCEFDGQRNEWHLDWR